MSPPAGEEAPGLPAWRLAPGRPSLPESYRTIDVPEGSGRFMRKLGAPAGPGYLVAVGYMDPGDRATDLSGGSTFGYTLLPIILLSNAMAIVLQALAARLGIPFAVVPLVQSTSDRTKIGSFVNKAWLKVAAWSISAVIIALNLKLLFDFVPAGGE